MKIRKYSSSDEEAVLRIHAETFLLGKPIKKILDNRKIVDSATHYYLHEEPESCFVLEEEGKVKGYLFGCLDDSKCNDRAEFLKTLPKMFFTMIFSKSRKNRKFAKSRLSVLIDAILQKSEDMHFKTPPNAGHLHINLLPEVRGKGYGSKLLKEFFKYARKKGVKLIHADSFDTKLNPNKQFWLNNGFSIYNRAKTATWKEYYPQEDIHIVCYVKTL